MKLGPFDISWSRKANGDVMDINTLVSRLEAVYESAAGISVTPENCEQSPTVKAMTTAVTRRFAVMPVHVYLKTTSKGRTKKELQPDHPVERLLAKPNDWQSHANYWMDGVSRLMRYGNYYAFKARGQTGPIRRLIPLIPSAVDPQQNDDWDVTYKVTMKNGKQEEIPISRMHHARLEARDGLKGDSPVLDVRDSIALEIAAERFGASLFGNGAMPGLVFKYSEGFAGHEKDEDRRQFVEDTDTAFGSKRRFRSMLLPKGIELGQQLAIENEKAQFIQLRQYQRTVIAGAWGCPPHLVGDLSKGTFNNVEQQDSNFTTNVILPLVRVFEAAMERDLLTDEDRRGGIIIRFNPDATLRANFMERQQGLAVQRQNGVINADEWREHEGMNPRTDGGGETYYEQGPSGQTPAQKPGDQQQEQDDEDEAAA